MLGGLLLGRLLGVDRLDPDLEEILEPPLQLERLRKEQLRIQRENRQRQPRLDRFVDHHQPGALEAGPNGRPRPKAVPSPREDVLGLSRLELSGEVVDIRGGDFFGVEGH